MLKEISIIIPVREEKDATRLLAQLEGRGAEVIVSAEGSRAKSLNIGAAKASRKFLWFLHADTHITVENMESLTSSLHEDETALHYFDLAFDSGKNMSWNARGANLRSRAFGLPFGDQRPEHMSWNARGANWRSHKLGLPFGDQGLAIRKDLFFKVGGYDKSSKYGEDHLFVWAARRRGIALKPIKSTIITSARAYEGGWLWLTLKRQFMWIAQALPQYWLLLRGK